MTETAVIAILGGPKALRRAARDRARLSEVISQGLPRRALEKTKEALALTDREMGELLGLSEKTVSRLRRSPRAHLGAVPSDRLYRIARLYAIALEALEDADLARTWLRTAQLGLGHRRPLDLMRTETGAREVEDLLGRIEHGVLS